ncbi:MAG TPA: hypothetical protein VI197_24245 [Polyangiaceae bacterium]
MSLRTLLENPSGDQLFSGLVVLALTLSLFGVLAYALLLAVIEGRTSDIGMNEIGLLLMSGAAIPAIVKFLRSRHGAR